MPVISFTLTKKQFEEADISLCYITTYKILSRRINLSDRNKEYVGKYVKKELRREDKNRKGLCSDKPHRPDDGILMGKPVAIIGPIEIFDEAMTLNATAQLELLITL